LYDGLGVVVGIMIGSGIFASAGTALKEAGSCPAALLAWVVAAALVAVASQCYCELGASVLSAGGDAEYLRLAYGDRAAFVFVWTNFWVLKPGSQAIIATVFGQYLEAALGGAAVGSSEVGNGGGGGSSWVATLLAVACIWALTANNCMSVRETANLQNGQSDPRRLFFT
jgi:amino acid transporter